MDALFAPDVPEIYPNGFSSAVDVGTIGTVYEGAVRPGHFRGVATVIAKLLNVVRPDVLVLGRKDAQQAVIVQKMVAELNVPVELELVPTVRERDGLAMSSRNRYLEAAQRDAAPSLYRALQALRDALRRGASKDEAIAAGERELRAATSVDYLDVVEATSFAPIEGLQPPAIVIGAARFGGTRLIDNLWIER